jgi:hypothetical protein
LDPDFGIVYDSTGAKCIETGGAACSEETKANARLITAAPAMLDAIKKHLRESGCDGDLCAFGWHEEFRQIIRSVEPDWAG